MPARLALGLNSGSLTTLQAPSSTKELVIDFVNKVETLETLNNQLVVRLQAHNRRKFKVNWVNITKAQLDTLMSYSNGTIPLWVRLEDDSVIIYDALSYVITDDINVVTNTNNFFYDVSLEILQIY